MAEFEDAAHPGEPPKGEALCPSVRSVLDRLYERHGRPEHPGTDDILATLISTILSQSTNNANSERAFDSLIERFGGDWAEVAHAPVEEVIDAIACGGLSRQKAPRIQAILRQIHEEHGAYSLEHLHKTAPAEARAALERFGGVGPKTASFTLMWAACHPVFPMDTHILRICQRLGWIGEKITGKKAHDQVEPHIPAEERYQAHVVMIRHGRTICYARKPACSECPLGEEGLCPSRALG